MPLVLDRPDFRPFPPITSAAPLTAAEERAVRAATALAGRHDAFNLFSVPGVVNRWGQAKRMRASEIIVSDGPFPSVSPEASLDPASGLHIALVEEEGGGVYGHAACVRDTPALRPLVVITDRHGRGWAYDTRTREAEPVHLHTAPLIREFFTGGASLAEAVPFSGDLSCRHGLIEGAAGKPAKPQPALLSAAEAVVGRIVDREDLIRRIAAPAFSDERLSSVLDTLTFPTKDGVIPDFSAPERRAFDDAMHEISLSAMRGLRDAGLCAPCPNNGPRGVRSLDAWDAFLRGELDATPLEGEALYASWGLSDAPAFRAVYSELIRASVDAEMAAREERGLGKDRKPGQRPPDVPMTRGEAEAVMRAFRERALRALSTEETGPGLEPELRGALESTCFGLAGSFLTPVLADRLTKTPLPAVEEPKAVRHLTLELPTGRLAMADWFRVPGFTEAMKELSGEEGAGFDINHAKGLDERAEAYFTKAGVAIVQVGNSSPAAYADTPGVWRMGHVDDEHEDFWDEETGARKALAPDSAWRTCTDLWANTFASVEAIVAVMMSSGEYRSEEDAERALTAYCEETYGAHIIDLGVDRLHLYLPTGYAERLREPMAGVGEGVLPREGWREDAYLLSAAPLPVAPGILDDTEWVAPPVRALSGEGPSIG